MTATLFNDARRGTFIEGAAGPIFVTVARPDSLEPGPALLLLPPFAEEMNKSRRMFALLARQLAARGWTVVLPDPHGTGDSAGDFPDARLETWLADGRSLIDALRKSGCGPLNLLGLRTGALLAERLARLDGDIHDLVFWQPASSGETYLRQFLRLRTAAGIIHDGATPSPAEELARQGFSEIGGYALSRDLHAGLSSLRLESPPPLSGRIAWFELGDGASRALRPAAAGLAAGWTRQGTHVQDAVIEGAPFWHTAEITVVPALLQATVHFLEEMRDG